MSRESELTIGFALVIAMGCGVSNAAAQTDKYPRMAAIRKRNWGQACDLCNSPVTRPDATRLVRIAEIAGLTPIAAI